MSWRKVTPAEEREFEVHRVTPPMPDLTVLAGLVDRLEMLLPQIENASFDLGQKVASAHRAIKDLNAAVGRAETVAKNPAFRQRH